MSTTTQAIHLIDQLVKAKIPKETATELVDYADKQKDKAINLQWVAIAILAAGLFTIIGMLWSLSQTIINLSQTMATKANIRDIKTDIKENRKLLLQVIQNQKR